MQRRPEPGRDHRGVDFSQPVVSSEPASSAQHVQLKDSHLQSRAGCAGPPFDMGAVDGGSGAEFRDGLVGVV